MDRFLLSAAIIIVIGAAIFIVAMVRADINDPHRWHKIKNK
jgi:hypothetical protein